MLDGHVVAGERRKVPTEQRTSGRRDLEKTVLDDADDGKCRQTLRSTRDREPSIDFVRDLVAAVPQAVRLRHFDRIHGVDRTTPEKAVSEASASSSRASACIGETVPLPCGRVSTCHERSGWAPILERVHRLREYDLNRGIV